MKIEKELIINTNPTKNGRSYDLSALKMMQDAINGRERSRNIGIIGHPESGEVNFRKAAFIYDNAKIENASLYVDIEPLRTEMGEELMRLLELKKANGGKGISFRPCGIGTVENGIVKDYELVTVGVVFIEEDAVQTGPDRRLLIY
jgi:hypothetical protein